MANYPELQVWQRSHALAVTLNRRARLLKAASAPGLRSQILRSSASIPANIAEGANQESDAQFARFLSIAIGSANELQNHLLFARDIGLLNSAESELLLVRLIEVRRMLYGLRKRLHASG